MSLRKKTVLVVAAVFAALLLSLNIISWIYIRGSYDKLERDTVEHDVAQAENVLLEEIAHIDTICRDWAFWDDTYRFMQDGDLAYVESNLTPEVLENLGLNVIMYVDPAGGVVYENGIDLPSGEERPPPPDLADQLHPGSVLLEPAVSEEGVSGVLQLEEGPLLLAAEPILTSQVEGPARGVLVMGRFLDEREIERLAEIAHQDIDIKGYEDAGLFSDFLEARDVFLAGEETDVQVFGPDSIAGYAPIEDIYGDPALILQVTASRPIHRQGVTTLVYVNIFLLFACIAFGLAVILLLERLVLSRLSGLSVEVKEIARSGDQAARVSAKGKDELVGLAASINTMLDRLERSEERFQSLTENALDMIAILDTEGRTAYESPSIEKTLGYERWYFLEHGVFELVHPDDLTMVLGALEKVMRAPGNVEQVELRMRHKDGSWRNLLVIGHNLTQDPHVGGIVINARDITGRVLVQERLERLNVLFQSLGAASHENIGKIVRAGREILGVAAAAYCRADRARFYTVSTEPGMETLREVKEPDGHIAFDIIAKDIRSPMIIEDIGAEGFLDSSPLVERHGYKFFAGYPVVSRGRTVGCISLHDAGPRGLSSDEVEILGTLAHALMVEEERMSNERDMREFLDVASHELRHPVTLMKGYALTLREYGERLDEASRAESLDAINRGAEKLDAMIGELLDVSRIERGRFVLNRRETDVEPVIRSAVEEMEGKGYGNEFLVDVEKDLPRRLVDHEKLAQVLIVLLDNACEQSPVDATIEVTAGRSGEEVLISVADRGVGIPEEERELIFQRFYQVDDPLGRSRAGLGLGLYIAREIVGAHGGRIWHENREGGGSVLRVSLPRG